MTMTQKKLSDAQSKQQPRHQLFNRADRFAQGWYWAIPSADLQRNKPQAVTLLGRELVLYRQPSGAAIALDARCPHRGASLANGRVQAGCIRCPFHGWQFDESGQCVSVQGEGERLDESVQAWPTAERYGLVWVWAGPGADLSKDYPLPHVPELAGTNCDAVLSGSFRRNCHPNVVLINAIDAHHFNSVHDLPLEVRFQTKALSKAALQFSNTTRGGEASRFVKLIQPLYPEAVTYRMCYWYGSTGTVTVGPDWLNFYLMFALRPAVNGSAGGATEGWVVLLAPERSGLLGWLFNRVALAMTKGVAAYFAKGDREVFDSIRFDFKTPLAADRSISQFVQHVDKQRAIAWQSWEPILQENTSKNLS